MSDPSLNADGRYSAHEQVSSGTRFGHGAEPLKSVDTHLFPQLMYPDLREAPGNGKIFKGFETAGVGGPIIRGIDFAMPLDVTDITDNGIVGGDPSLASLEACAAQGIIGSLSTKQSCTKPSWPRRFCR